MEIDEALQNKRKRLYDETSSELEEETSTTNTSNSLSSTNSQSSTNTSNSQRGTQKSNGHYKATYYYCNMSWSRGKLAKLEAHLANKCDHCPNDISQYWREKLAEKPQIISENQKSSVVDQFDQKILKGWIMVGIPFDVIENPFIQDMFKALQLAYNLPSRSILSDRLLNEELARVNKAIDNDLDKADHLTL
ncbi:27960_t:CDS:2, partial [Gigaspora margarita]